MTATSLNKVFGGKKIRLHAPAYPAETLRCARYLPGILDMTDHVSLMIKDDLGMGKLLASTFPKMKVFAPDTPEPFPHDTELNLEKLPALFAKAERSFPSHYLHPPPDTLQVFQRFMQKTGKINVGLALYDRSENTPIDSVVISKNITLSQLHTTQFFFIPTDPNKKEPPPFSHFQDTAGLVKNYGEMAAFVASLDALICLDNDAAHLAAALGKPVWLLTPMKPLSDWKPFPNVTVFQPSTSGDWKEAIRAIALFRLLQPDRLSFQPFSPADMTLDQPSVLPFPNIHFEDPGQLTQLLDADLTTFSGVILETTTLCNRKCAYCPHSTDAAKAPAFMSEEIFSRIIDSLYDYLPGYDGAIIPCLYGEPLLDKRLESFIQYAKNKFPKACLHLITNGDFLTAERFFALREAGLTRCTISQHSPELPQELSHALERIQQETPDATPMLDVLKMEGRYKFNRGGLVQIDLLPTDSCAQIPGCSLGYSKLTFDHRGEAVLCCNDYSATHTFGSITSKTVQEIWDDKTYRQTRNLLMFGFLPFPICRVCLSH